MRIPHIPTVVLPFGTLTVIVAGLVHGIWNALKSPRQDSNRQ